MDELCCVVELEFFEDLGMVGIDGFDVEVEFVGDLVCILVVVDY